MSPPEVAAMRSDTVAAGNGDATTSGEADGERVAQATGAPEQGVAFQRRLHHVTAKRGVAVRLR